MVPIGLKSALSDWATPKLSLNCFVNKMQLASEESWQREMTTLVPAQRVAAGHKEWKETSKLILTHNAVLLGAAQSTAGVWRRGGIIHVCVTCLHCWTLVQPRSMADMVLVHDQEGLTKQPGNVSWANLMTALRAQMVLGCGFEGNRTMWSIWDILLHSSRAQPQTDSHTSVFSMPFSIGKI